MRIKLDDELSQLDREMISLGALCEEAISRTSHALETGGEGNEKVAELARNIDRKERDVESMCLRILLQQQPVARDLRRVSAAMKMIYDMERIGDQAEDITEISEYLGKRGTQELPLRQMTDAAAKMVTGSVNAFVKQDVILANTIINNDDTVDALFSQVKKDLIALIAQNPEDGQYALDLLMAAKHIERVADHAVNIAGWVVFSVTGEHKGGKNL